MKAGFTHQNVPNMAGKVALITGANTGLGFEAAKVLAANNAQVIIGCRNNDKAKLAIAAIQAHAPSADVSSITLSLDDLTSVKHAVDELSGVDKLDLLINNAGIMVPPLERTADGFESQFGVNHLGPFALTGLLLDKMIHNPGARIINTSSLAANSGKILFDDINADQGYEAMQRYCMSKLANLMYSAELDQRLKIAGAQCISVACHPGVATTELSRYLPSWISIAQPLVKFLFNTAAQGAWPTLQAATDPSANRGGYYGPSRRRQTSGPSIKVPGERKNSKQAQQLWQLSEQMTGVSYL
jgi:NAD(P)-dependent dehydrogenase (short-subunit alcohol dehydrogenase family)